MLNIIATPIGNLKDITLRSIEILKEVDGIICEDTRRTKILLDHYQIQKPLFTLNDFNETKQFPIIIDNLKIGKNLALVSDAGTPLISDPGYKLIRECINEKIEIDSLPGPVSPIVALTLSGFPPDKFMFLGYLPEKPGQREKMFKNLTTIYQLIPTTFITFVAPHKLVKTLTEMQTIYDKNLNVCIAKELTKIYQKVTTKPLESWLETLKKSPPKGEYILLFRPNN